MFSRKWICNVGIKGGENVQGQVKRWGHWVDGLSGGIHMLGETV